MGRNTLGDLQFLINCPTGISCVRDIANKERTFVFDSCNIDTSGQPLNLLRSVPMKRSRAVYEYFSYDYDDKPIVSDTQNTEDESQQTQTDYGEVTTPATADNNLVIRDAKEEEENHFQLDPACHDCLRVDAKDVRACFVCKISYCTECAMMFRCLEDSVHGDETEYEIPDICEDCIKECPMCQLAMCKPCLSWRSECEICYKVQIACLKCKDYGAVRCCGICKRNLCEDCIECCSVCNENRCPSCAGNYMEECQYCSKRHCEDYCACKCEKILTKARSRGKQATTEMLRKKIGSGDILFIL